MRRSYSNVQSNRPYDVHGSYLSQGDLGMNTTRGALVGGLVAAGAVRGAHPSYSYGGVGAILTGAMIGAGYGYIAGSRHQLMILHEGEAYHIPIRNRQRQPKFDDLFMRDVTARQYQNIRDFFAVFNSDANATDIKCCNRYDDYYFVLHKHEYSLNPVTLKFEVYDM